MWGDTANQTFAERGDAIGRRLTKLQSKQSYQALSPEERVNVRAAFYARHVLPAYKRAGIAAPDLKDWLLDSTPKTEAQDATLQFAAKAKESAQKIALFGAKVTYQAFKSAYAAQEYWKDPNAKVNDLLFSDYTSKGHEIASKAKDRADQSLAGKAVRSINDQVQSTDFWLRTHPRDSFLAQAAGWAGEQLIQLPVWEALGQTKAGEVALQKLSPRLAQTPIGRMAGRRLNDAFGGFVGNMVTSGNTSTLKENVEAGLQFAVFGEAFEGAAAWLEKLGKRNLKSPMTESVLRDVEARANASRPLELPSESQIHDGEYIHEPVNTASDSAIKKWSGQHHAMGGQPMVEDNIQLAFNELVRPKELTATTTPYTNALELDPTIARMSTGEKMALQSLALRHYGVPMQALPEEFQHNILQRRLELMHEAASELPIHVPDLNYEEAAHNLKSWMASANPSVEEALKYLQSKGIDTAKVVSDNQIKSISEQTGVRSEKAAARNAERVTARPKARTKNVGLKEGASAKITPADFKSVRDDSVAYLKNPSKGRRAADGTLVGARDKRAWNERLKSNNFDDFIEDLKYADGNHIQFENPVHRLLFHYANRSELPSGVKDKTLRMLKFKLPGHKAEELGKMADRLLVHLLQLSQTGRLSAEKNVFKSSNFAGAPTKWQFDLNTEIDEQELEMLRKTVAQHPGGQKAMESIAKVFQANRRMALNTDPEQWILYNKALDNLVTGVIK